MLRRVTDRLAALGYAAQVGVEIEFHLLDADGRPLFDGAHAYSLQKLNELDPVIGEILSRAARLRGPRGWEQRVRLGAGGGQPPPRRSRSPPPTRPHALKYATREIARRAGVTATFMAKPFADESGNSMHLHVSLWRDGEPAFAPEGDDENALHRRAIAGLLAHLPGITLYDAPTVNSYKRFEALSFAPTTATWGGDNRTVAVRSLVAGRRRHPARAAHRRGRCAAALGRGGDAGGDRRRARVRRAAGAAHQGRGQPLRQRRADPGDARARGSPPLARTPRSPRSWASTRSTTTRALAELEWGTFVSAVSDWDRDRYLRAV